MPYAICEVTFACNASLAVRSSRIRSRRAAAGFSLVEIVIAMAVIASALLVVLGMLGVGMSTFQQAKATSVSSQIAQQIFSQIQVAPFSSVTNHAITAAPTQGYYQLPNPNASISGNTRFFDDQGNETVQAGSVYWVNVRVITATQFLGTAATYNNNLATITIQVAFNPGGFTPNPDGTLKWDGTSSGPRLQIYTYDSFLAQGT